MAGGTRGQIIDGRFELLDMLGSGGMGTVWRARDTVLHREVALKEVRPVDPAMTPEDSEASRLLRERVLREAQALARLSHRHVVTVHHIVDQGPYPWIVMELLPGNGLHERLAQGPLEAAEAAGIGLQVLEALRAAHAAGIQHRDVKPANVLLREDGSAVLTDFGIAALQGSSSLTATGELIGSPEYIAPERIRGTADDPSSDLWSLGMTLYVCTEGHSPLRRGTSLATLAAVLDDPVPPPVRSGGLTPVLNALLVRDPAERPDAGQLADMLADAAAGRTAAPYLPTRTAVPRPAAFQAPPPPSPVRPPGEATPRTPVASQFPTAPPRTSRRGRGAMVAGAAVAVAALIAGSAFLITRGGDTSDSADGGGPGPTRSSKSPDAPKNQDTRTTEPGSPRPLETPTPSGPGSPTASASAPPTSEAPLPGDAGSDAWVAQLASVPKTDGATARAQRHRALNSKVPGVRYVDSDKYGSLREGYWMFYVAGPEAGGGGEFGDGNAVADWCASEGMTSSDECVGRYLSDDPGDRVYLCAADKSAGTGRCTRP
ncbi:protein kinase [Streptomyces sp. N2-109]|uniref:non-specific serine/threonine protein kinase n=1 Tax=Streptomyces gossypii TaxID=2883101 RepID=A0ABT2JZQ6_9ACTN|nr:serine/threonine-protein kinase [Streptomyces gossypii]MCT2593398.1 protein kinase [Streptomyces gossypii]